MFLACFFERRLLRRRSFLLMLRAPFFERHAVDDLAALVLASSARLCRRRHPSSSSTGSCGRSRRDSSCRCSARRCARAGARPAGGRRRLQVRCGSSRRGHDHPPSVRQSLLVQTIAAPRLPATMILRKTSLHFSGPCARYGNIETRLAPFHTALADVMDGMDRTARAFLESLFRSAVAAAHPAAVPAAASAEPPARGRLIILAAGKAAGSMTEVAEQHYLGAAAAATARRPRRHAPRLWAADAAHSGDRGRPSGARTPPASRRPSGRSTLADAVDAERSGAGAAVRRRVGQLDRAGRRADARGQAGGDAGAAALGAAIGEINTVRKHLSRIKGGRLAARASPPSRRRSRSPTCPATIRR